MEAPKFSPSDSPQFGDLIGEYHGRRGYQVALVTIAVLSILLGIVGNCAGTQLDPWTRLLFIVALPLVFFAHLYYGYSPYARVFEDGFTISRGAKTTSIRWENIARVTHAPQQIRLLGIIPLPGSKYQNYTIILNTDKRLHIYGMHFSNSQELGNIIMQMVSQANAVRPVKSTSNGSATSESGKKLQEMGQNHPVLVEQVLEWVTTSDKGKAREYLRSHALTILTDQAEQMLGVLQAFAHTDEAKRLFMDSSDSTELTSEESATLLRDSFKEDLQLLRDARQIGIDAAYDKFLAKRGIVYLSPTGNAQMDKLLQKLHKLANDNTNTLFNRTPTPRHQEDVCRRILELDNKVHVLDPLRRGAVLGERSIAFQEWAEQESGQQRITLLRRAIVCLEDALQVYRREEYPLLWANGIANKARTLLILAEHLTDAEQVNAWQDAITYCNDGLQEYRQDVDALARAVIFTTKVAALGKLAESQTGADYVRTLREALACNEGAIRVYRREGSSHDLAIALSNKGITLVSLAGEQTGKLQLETLFNAVAASDEALRHLSRERAPHHEHIPSPQAPILANKGAALLLLADHMIDRESIRTLRDALNCYDAALREYRRDKIPFDWANVQAGRGNALLKLAGYLRGAERTQSLRAAVACFNEALLEFRRDVAPIAWANIIVNKGAALQALAVMTEKQSATARLQALDESIKACRDALTVFSSDVQPDKYRGIARGLARAYLVRTDFAKDTDTKQATLEQAWHFASAATNAAKRLEMLAPSLPFRQREWAENAILYNLSGCIRARQGYLDDAVALIEHGRARGLAEAAGRRSADLSLLTDDERDTYLQAVEVIQTIEAQSRQGNDPLALVEEARVANERLAAVVARLRSTYPNFLPERNASASILGGALQSGEVLMYLIPQDAGTLLLAVSERGQLQSTWLTNLTSNDISTLAVHQRSDNDSQSGFLPAALGLLRHDRGALARALDELLPQLGDQLMRYVVAMARDSSCQRVVLVPSGYLSVLPLHAATYAPLDGEPATAPEGRRYACDDLAITYAPSGLTLLDAHEAAAHQRREGPARQIFIAGNPQLTLKDQSWTPQDRGYLRYAEWEARTVGEIARQRMRPLNVDMVLDEQATWECVTQRLGEADVAHLALHATFNYQEPEQSAFLVAFGVKLLLRDLLDARLANLTQLRLVTLSACQSALSDFSRQSEEAVGLFGALLAGGVPGVIGTLWSVNDLATAALMESFAWRYLVAGDAADLALRGATRNLRGMRDVPADGSAAEQTAKPTSALRRWRELAERDPQAVDGTRLLTSEEFEAAEKAVHRFVANQDARPIAHNHPIYWAAFVFHGASVPLDGDEHSA